MRVGIGYDIHPLKKGRKLLLGGVRIPFAKGLGGHSDGDVLLHAVVDAVLGAMSAGDIGEHFPSQDSRTRGANSLLFVKKAVEILKRRKLKIANIDAVLIAEAPKLSGYKAAIQKAVARAFGITVSQVGIKAKTNEGFGPIGKNEAITCFAVASLRSA